MARALMGVVLAFGELLIRLIAPAHELCAQAPSLAQYVGGVKANFAIGLANLGHGITLGGLDVSR